MLRTVLATAVLWVAAHMSAHATAIATDTITNLRVELLGLPTGSCDGIVTTQSIAQDRGGGSVEAIDSAVCSRVGDSWVLDIGNLSATAFAGQPDPVRDHQSYSLQEASWNGTLPGVALPGGTLLSVTISFDYSYALGTSGKAVDPDVVGAYEDARLDGGVFLYAPYAVFIIPFYDPDFQETAWDLVGQPFPHVANATGSFTQSFDVGVGEGETYFLGAFVSPKTISSMSIIESPTSVPEPGTLSLLVGGLLLLAWRTRLTSPKRSSENIARFATAFRGPICRPPGK